mmetsp:Transcript_4202/g.15498  ORF Transcript_4202/g.15498 Transcript_4202/m.15498 type:complete len:242 (-) Transcript_4202:48-773(-)|eukprot:CAMPEP_0203815234 /NCGR_PEP_ID=MMETSP0115-20131106/8983_1 /ASSEMBLY_ACC=CAM_ASM_000227 /TAXON_ID=33651 /ORGANISM="Bicosoecid sp, Strain ms1" /LENGTH=241 /DNA_ID=CAMNT_0050724129 /DNA_START=33 /DNA_END=758 /DNA_ORIENTATION=+
MASESKWAVVTGANRGIGFELARQLAGRGFGVVAGCRKTSEQLTALAGADGSKVVVCEGADVSTDEGVAALLASVSAAIGDGGKVSLLINNAGILEVDNVDNLAENLGVVERQLMVNAVAPLRVTSALLPLLEEGTGKVAFITSRMGSIGDNGSGGMYGYRMSKAALNAGAMSFARDLKKTKNIAVAILHPGMVTTDMTTRFGGGIPPEESVTGLLARIDGLTLDNTGTFWHGVTGEVLPW